MTYAFLGWCIEVLGKLISEKKFINRGFLIGPYCPIYGYGVLILTLGLQKYYEDPFTLFIMSILSCSILEYTTSFLLEKIFHTRWWDYHHFKFNINGRICLETMIPFGLGGLFVIYRINPFFYRLYSNLSPTILYALSAILFLLYITDNIVTFKIMNEIKTLGNTMSKKRFMAKDETEKITKLVREHIEKSKKRLNKRLIHAFPHLEVLKQKKKSTHK